MEGPVQTTNAGALYKSFAFTLDPYCRVHTSQARSRAVPLSTLRRHGKGTASRRRSRPTSQPQSSSLTSC
eukprot:6203981-Pleurochrysis_carterae.AAC.1